MDGEKNILVTGGAGFIGSHTVVELIAAGYIPVILDDFSNSRRFMTAQLEKITGKPVILEEGDCTNETFVDSVFAKYKFHGVIHFAAYKAVNESVNEPLKYYSNNIGSLLVLLKAMKKHSVSNLVFSSSCTVYGIPAGSPVVNENTPLGIPASPYGWTKYMCEQIIRDTVSSGSGINAVLLRYFNPVGAHASGLIGELPQGTPNNILPYITQTAAGKLEQLTVFGNDYNTADGTCVRDFIHVTDLALAHLKALEFIDSNPGISVFNVGTGKGTSVLELVSAFEEASGKELNRKFGPRRDGDVPEIYADVTLATAKLGWKAERTVKDAVRDSWNWEQKRLANDLV